MSPSTSKKAPAAPKATAVEVVSAQPTQADRDAIAHLSAQANRSLPGITYLVLVVLKVIPPATSEGWALYLGAFRIPKYWEYSDGIYFKVFDPQFFVEHRGQRLRFSQDEKAFIDTGLKLTAPPAPSGKAAARTRRLPRQEDVLQKKSRRGARRARPTA